jgi:hypothetical protein
MKECFDDLRRQIPCADYGRSSNLKVLRVAIEYVQVFYWVAICYKLLKIYGTF